MRAVALLLALVLPATAATIRPRIVNGVGTSSYPTVGILLVGTNASSASLQCTGTMIGCRTFLTAAHCVCDGDGPDCLPGGTMIPNPARHFVFLQHAGVFAVQSIALRSDFVFPVADVAVVTLADPITGVTPSAINLSGSPSNGAAGTIVGFGRSGGSSFDYGIKRQGAVQLATCTTESNVSSVCWTFENPLGLPGEDSNTCNGDSGGPLFVDVGGGPVVAGVTSGGVSDNCTPFDESYDANVFHYASWIAGVAGNDLGTGACGAISQVGDPTTSVASTSGTLSAANPIATWSIIVPDGVAELRLALNGDDAADFDLYARAGDPPDTVTYDCKADGPNPFGYCSIPTPTAGPWYVQARRFSGQGAYQLTATVLGEEGTCAGVPVGGSCDDGNPCTSVDVCTASGCQGTPVTDGTACDDGAACTRDDACQAGVCAGVAAPRDDCRLPASANGSTFVMKHGVPNTKDTFSWRWARGTATVADWGNPGATDAYTLCVYDRTADVPSLVLEKTIPGSPLWKPTSTGWKRVDATGASGGITHVVLKASPQPGRASILLKGKGSGLVLPSLPLAKQPSVTVQLVGPEACFAATYTAPVTNDSVRFHARSSQ